MLEISLEKIEITKENIGHLLYELAKTYRKISGRHAKTELTIVGGGSILINYDFRNSTMDIDTYYIADSSTKDAFRIVAEKYNLNDDWVNNNFI